MKNLEFARCRALPAALTLLLALLTGAHMALGQAPEQTQPPSADTSNGESKDQPNAAPEGEAKDAASCKDGTLVITVLGQGQPISHAAIKVTYEHSDGDTIACPEGQLPPTDEHGQAKFSSSGEGRVRILVLKTGWETGRLQLDLAKGDQNETIALVPTH